MTTEENVAVVQDTNDSATRSKASMEARGYLPHAYSSAFCDKVPRRAALINRGYYFRVHLVRTMLRRIIDSTADHVTLVILGAGFDTTFLWLRREHPQLLHRVSIIEVDLVDVARRKTASLLDDGPSTTGRYFSAAGIDTCIVDKGYFVVGADLNHLARLNEHLTALIHVSATPPSTCVFLSECVLSYMERDFADSIVKWAATAPCFGVGSRHLLVYEQLLKTSRNDAHLDAFSRTMLAHFDKLQCPLHSSHAYPHQDALADRFTALGWTGDMRLAPLSEWYYQDPQMMSEETVSFVNAVEPFDEWEEWDLKLAHYYFLHVTTSLGGDSDTPSQRPRRRDFGPTTPMTVEHCGGIAMAEGDASLQRWGHSCCLVDGSVLAFGGFGTHRCNRVFRIDAKTGAMEDVSPTPGSVQPEARMFHCAVTWDTSRMIVCGGRASPTKTFADVWCLDTVSNQWQRLDDPNDSCRPNSGFYRGRCLLVKGRYLVVIGGITDNSLVAFDLASCRWMTVDASLAIREAVRRFGFGLTPLSDVSCLIIGGCTPQNSQPSPINALTLHFDIVIPDSAPLTLTVNHTELELYSNGTPLPAIRFHQLVQIDDQHVLLLGGLSWPIPLQAHQAILINMADGTWGHMSLFASLSLPPLLVRHELLRLTDGSVMIVGGGATVFSMGTHHDGIMRITFDGAFKWPQISVTTVTINDVSSSVAFEAIQCQIKHQMPALLRKLDWGPCLQRWDDEDYLRRQCGEQLVSVHACSEALLQFSPTRNYTFQVMSLNALFDRFIQEQTADNVYYFRAIGANPRKQPARLEDNFPMLADDLRVPCDLLPQLKSRFFSSVLRLGSVGTVLWTHYDVMDNVLVHIGPPGVVRRVTLWPPSDLTNLYVNDSSSIIPLHPRHVTRHPDPEIVERFPRLARTRPLVVDLHPGDTLYIPALWFHHVVSYALNSDQLSVDQPSFSIAINLFWRGLTDDELYHRKDLYGNQDPIPAQDAQDKMVAALQDLQRLPEHYRHFYRLKLQALLEDSK